MGIRLRTMLVVMMMSFVVMLVGCGDSETAVKGETDVSEVNQDVELEEWSAAWVVQEGKKFEETGEGDSKADLVSRMNDETFDMACGIVDEDCIEMCEDVMDSRCQYLCAEDFGSNSACTDALTKVIEEKGVLEGLDIGFMSGTVVEASTDYELIEPGQERVGIHHSFHRLIEQTIGEGVERRSVRTVGAAVGVSMVEKGYKYENLVETYGYFEPFMSSEYLTDILLVMDDGTVFYMDIPKREVAEPRDYYLIDVVR